MANPAFVADTGHGSIVAQRGVSRYGWQCPSCQADNIAAAMNCEACGFYRVLWPCPISVCGWENAESSTRCEKCEAPRPAPIGPGEVVTVAAPPEEVNHPRHYNDHPSGVECIDIVEAFNFNVGNAIKYLWRAGLKGELLEDLRKAHWYIGREIERRTKGSGRA